MNAFIVRRLLPLGLLVLLAGCASQLDTGPNAAKPQKRGGIDAAAPLAPPARMRDVLAAGQPAALESAVTLGDDRFLKRPPPAGATVVGRDGGEVTLNFNDAEIREVVRSILGDILQLNYTVDPEVVGTVTIQTSQPIARADLLPTLENLLQSASATMIRDGGLFKITALIGQAAGNFALRPARDGGAGFGVQVVPLRFIAAGEMAEILRLFAPEGRVLKVDGTRNLLLFSGTREDRDALLEAVALFDIDQFSGMSFGLFPLRNAKAETLVEELKAIFGAAGGPLAKDLLRLVPVARLNAVIAISPRAQYLKQAKVWIERLDQGVDGVGPRLNVYKVQNVRAEGLAKVLSEIFAAPAEKNTKQPVYSPVVLAAPRQDGGRTDTSDSRTEPATPAGGGESSQPGRVGSGIAVTASGRIRIIADENTNALLILATPEEYKMVERSIRKLDVVPLQVLIEATIVEVTLNDALRFGVQWFLDSGRSEFTLSEVATGVAAQTFPGFSALFRSGTSARVVLNALESVTDVNVVSSPQILVLDNQTAELQVGDQVPIATRSAVSVDNPQAPVVNSIEFRDTGVILRVTPRVNAGGLVVMEIAQEVSSVINTTTSGIDSPTIQQRRINSTVAIQSGEMVTLGGLISETRTRASTGVPVLAKIPILGALFGRKNDSTVRTELLVLITPRVVANKIDARRITAELRGRLRTLKPLIRKVQ